MKTFVKHLPYPYYWKITFVLSYECEYCNDVIGLLLDTDCPDNIIEKAYRQLTYCADNLGLTYNNPEIMQSVVVVGRASSKKEFFNTLSHEMLHLLLSVMRAYDINPDSEQAAYLFGDMMMCIYDNAHDFVCTHCSDSR